MENDLKKPETLRSKVRTRLGLRMKTKKQKHYFRYDFDRLIRLLEARDRTLFERLQEGAEDVDTLSEAELVELPVEKMLSELQAKSTVLLFESSRRLEKLTWVLLLLTAILTVLTGLLIFRTV